MKESKASIGLIDPKTPENVSRVMRAAGNFSVDKVFYTGKRYLRALARNPGLPNISRKVSEHVSLSAVNSLIDEAAEDMKIVCVELAENAVSLPEYQHPQRALYIFGPEDGTIEQQVIDKADAVVYIPTVDCLNLAATVSVVLYDRLAKSSEDIAGNELIRKSRCTNNNLKVK